MKHYTGRWRNGFQYKSANFGNKSDTVSAEADKRLAGQRYKTYLKIQPKMNPPSTIYLNSWLQRLCLLLNRQNIQYNMVRDAQIFAYNCMDNGIYKLGVSMHNKTEIVHHYSPISCNYRLRHCPYSDLCLKGGFCQH